MKVYLSNYRNHWLSPYTIIEKVLFWQKEVDYDNKTVKKLAGLLAPVSEGVKKALDLVHPRINYVKIDKHDTWNMDSTLAGIILPMLVQLKATKHGVPSKFATTGGENWNSQAHFDFYDTDDELFKKAAAEWDAVLDKMIFAFEHIVDEDWEEEFRTGEFDSSKAIGEEGWTGTYKCDHQAVQKVYDQIQEGLELFGKHYRHLWD
jgi:hypothetical protein